MDPKVYILDGGFSSQIAKYVGEKIDNDPLWTARFLLTEPDAVIQTHLDFLRAGSEVIETNTYQASIGGFKKYLNISDEKSKCLIQTAVALAEKAVEKFKLEKPGANPIIAGSIGPYGAALHDGSEYTGSYADFTLMEEIKTWHKPRLEALIESGVKMFAIETIPCEMEALALAELLKDYPNIKAWMSFSCKGDQLLSHGEIFHEVAVKTYLTNPEQIVAVGVNCLNPCNVLSLLRPINDKRVKKIPLIVYPNSGENYIDGHWTGEATIAHIENFLEEWIKAGVRYVGGCCRTTAENISFIKEKIEQLHQK